MFLQPTSVGNSISLAALNYHKSVKSALIVKKFFTVQIKLNAQNSVQCDSINFRRGCSYNYIFICSLLINAKVKELLKLVCVFQSKRKNKNGSLSYLARSRDRMLPNSDQKLFNSHHVCNSCQFKLNASQK